MKRYIRYTLILTFPISVFFALWVYNTYSFYLQTDKLKSSFKILDKGSLLYRTGIREFIELKEKIIPLITSTQVISDVNIYTNSKNIKELNHNLPRSAYEEKKALLSIDNNIYPGKTRYRGDYLYHWLMPHKSWRFKTKKNNLYMKYRKWNFINLKNNELGINHISYKLAKILNLLAPESELKTLSVNNNFNGLKMMVAQIDESFLRINRRMPNDIYKGDNIGSKTITGVSIDTIFDVPSIWEKSSINNHYPTNNFIPLTNLFQQLDKGNNNLLDRQSFIDLMVFIDLTSTYHYDNQHNWVLYYDNYFEKFYPIIWDPSSWQYAWRAKKQVNICTSKLLISLYNDYSILIDKYYAMYDFFLKKEKPFLDILDNELNDVKNKIDEIGYSYSAEGIYHTNLEIHRSADILQNNIQNRFQFVKKSLLGTPQTSDYEYQTTKKHLKISISGNKLITKIYLTSRKIKTINKIYLNYRSKDGIVRTKIPFSFDLDKNQLILNVNLLAHSQLVKSAIEFKKATYDIEIPGFNLNQIESVSLSTLALKENVFPIKKVSNISTQVFSEQKNIITKHLNQNTQTWEKHKNIKKFTIIRDNITIAPGTHIIFDENATLKVLGKVTAIGTKENPIVFEAKDKTKPWNAFALKDAKANGSVFKHCIFKDGSGDKGDLYEYTAMFSVHNVKNLLVEDCEFYDSKRTDDMVHVIYSDATFKNSRFIRSLSDALDVDISNLIVDNCEFINSGNDSIDLMTTNAVVTNTKFTNSKDKGISIGEGSNLLAINNHIQGSEIGMQSKDTSQAYIYNTSFINNKKAIDAYHKNWRYSEGGSIYLDKCLFESNIENATVGKKSKVVINDSTIDTPETFDTKSIRKKKINISDKSFIIPELTEPVFENRNNLINKSRKGYHE